jgi:hypothetical protein
MQCVAFPGVREGEIELPNVLEVCDGDTASEFVAQLAGEMSDELAAIVGAGILQLRGLGELVMPFTGEARHRRNSLS